jgi:hypothetical protein
MLNQDYYVREKLRELEQQRLTHLSRQPVHDSAHP